MPKAKGTPKTGGRKKGTPNKLTLSIKDSVLETFQRLGGVNHMVEWAQDSPADFYRIAAKLIPQQINSEVTRKYDVSELTTDELERIATGGSTGAAKAQEVEAEPDSVH